MNQQQYSQGSSSQFEDDKGQSTLASPWLIQKKGRRHGGPKSEHPSTYDESIPPLSYHAQDQRQTSSSSPPQARVSLEATHKTSPDGTTPQTAYRPYSQYTGSWQVPPWARPQQNNFEALQFFVWFIIAIALMPVLIFFIVNVLIPLLIVIFQIFLIVLFILGILLLAFAFIAILWIIGKINSIKPPFWW
jgi:hypothetical protein